MRKQFFALFAAAAMVLTGCSSDDAALKAPVADGTVSFTVALPADMASRAAISDGARATQLTYSVYQKTTTGYDYLYSQTVNPTWADLKTQVNIPLVKGLTYRVSFFAQDPNATCFTLTDEGDITIDYTEIATNSDVADAFYGYPATDVAVSETTPAQTVELYRPFAQVNVGAADWKVAKTAGLVVPDGGLTFSGDVYTTLKMEDGAAADVVTAAVEYAPATWPNKNFAATAPTTPDFLDAAGTTDVYYWMTMAYVLVPADAETAPIPTVTFNYTGNAANSSVDVNSVPVRRNYRTNIIGNFFTQNVEYNIEIVPGFQQPDYEVNVTQVSTAAELTEAIADAPEGEKTTIQFTDDIDIPGGVAIPANKEIAFDLGDNTMNVGTGFVRAPQDASVEFNGGTVTGSGAAVLVASGGNATINGTTIDTSNANIAVQASAGGNVEIKGSTINCSKSTATNAQISALAGSTIKVENTVVNNETAGYSFITIDGNLDLTDVTLNNNGSNFSVVVYGDDATATLNNVDITAPNAGTSVIYANGTSLNVKGGSINAPKASNGFNLTHQIDATVEDVDITVDNCGIAIFPEDGTDVELNVKGCNITSKGFGISTNASQDMNTTIVVENTVINSGTPLLFNNGGTIKLTKCQLNGTWIGAFVRAGQASFNDCDIVLNTSKYADEAAAAEAAVKYDGDWDQGSMAPSAAITFGNKNGNYNFDAIVNLTNCRVKVEGTYADKFWTVYGATATANPKAANLTYDAATTFTGGKGNNLLGDATVTER